MTEFTIKEAMAKAQMALDTALAAKAEIDGHERLCAERYVSIDRTLNRIEDQGREQTRKIDANADASAASVKEIRNWFLLATGSVLMLFLAAFVAFVFKH